MGSTEDLSLLHQFVIDNKELEEMEDLLSEFNIFEVLGVVSRELKHSNFLSWLFDPKETHSLGDYFLKKFLKIASAKGHTLGNYGVSPVEIDFWDLSQLTVMREWHNIDLLLEDTTNQFVCVIENKIFTSEHSNQLSKYRNDIEQHYPGWKKMFVFLTPDGVSPLEEDESKYYIPISYEDVGSLLSRLIEVKRSTVSSEVLTFIVHYFKVLRRHIMSESELQKLAQLIYKKHKKALDIIYEYRPDLQMEIYDFLVKLVQAEAPRLIPEGSQKQFVRFSVDEFERIPQLQEGSGWTKTGRILLFEFKNFEHTLSLTLVIGPGTPQVREKIHEKASFSEAFTGRIRSLSPNWSMIYKKDILKKSDYEKLEIDEIQTKIKEKFVDFLKYELDKIVDAISNINY